MELLIPNCFYHIYNRANGSGIMFKDPKNYNFFLHRFKYFILPIARVYVYCLIPNHFHFLIKVKDQCEIIKSIRNNKSIDKYRMTESIFEKERILSLYISKQFANLFSSYTQSFNRMYDRKGSLFMKNFKRRIVVDERYLQELVIYIHNNPIKHGIVNHPENWFNSSYNTILSDKGTFINRKEVINLFDDIDNFIFCHQ